jgi:hypothetical protein
MKQALKLKRLIVLVAMGAFLATGAVSVASAAASAPVIVNDEGEEIVHKHFTGTEPGDLVFEGHEGALMECLDASSSVAGEITGLRSLKLTVTYTGCEAPSHLPPYQSCNTSEVMVAHLIGKPAYLNKEHTIIGFVYEPEEKNKPFVKCEPYETIGVQEAGKGGMDSLATTSFVAAGKCSSPGQQEWRSYWEGESSIAAYLEGHAPLSTWQEVCVNGTGGESLKFEETAHLAAEAVKKIVKPRLQPAKGEAAFPVAFTPTGGKMVLESEQLKVECKQQSGGAGKFTTAKEAKLTLKFTECTAETGLIKCTTSGAKAGEIETKELTGLVEYTDPSKTVGGARETGLVLSPASGETLAEFNCSALVSVALKGSLIGVLSPLNTLTKSPSLTLKRTGFVQVPSEYETRNTNTKVAVTSTCSVNSARAYACAVESASTLAFTGEEALIEV